jgi:hypothetical protein
MSLLKPIHIAFVVAFALGVAGQSLVPASAQVFVSRMDQGKKECEGKHGTFKQESSDNCACTYTSSHKVDHCAASTGKCSTSDMPAAASASSPSKKSLAGTGDVSKDELKKICARNKDWLFVEDKSGPYSCMDTAGGIAINCKNKNDCTEAHTQVHAR